MRASWIAIAVLALPTAAAYHDTGTCVPTAADASLVRAIVDPVDDRVFYLEERDGLGSPAGPVPLSGALSGGLTWLYEEVNTVSGLQRGGISGANPWCFPAAPWPLCLLTDEDPIEDETCAHGPDTRIVGIGPGAPPA